MSHASFTTPDGYRLIYDIEGSGPAVLWQHGLGASLSQPLDVFPDIPVTRITLACRGHDESDLGPLEELSIAKFTTDILALLEYLKIEKLAAVGGISLGAAVSLRLAAYYPELVSRLILARPACVDEPALHGHRGYIEAGRHLELYGAKEGERRFRASEVFRVIEAASPDNANSLLGYFTRPRPATTTALLARLTKDWSGVPISMLEQIRHPTLVIANGEDFVHPISYAKTLAKIIPKAHFEEIPSKTQDATKYTINFKAVLAKFITAAP
jgi:pimeloyl-ACP methyl ester carboxylesterase